MPYPHDALAGKTILVAEDDYLLADTIDAEIRSAGGIVQGPFTSAKDALGSLLLGTPPPDAATLNVQLSDGDSYPVADELTRRGIPFVFASGNNPASVPSRFTRVAAVPKPYAAHQVVQALVTLTHEEDR